MSGGMWNYLSRELSERADQVKYAAVAMELLAVIEHEMDWGISGDTCYECAANRVIAALEDFFSSRATNSMSAKAVARDHLQNRCPKCEEREAAQKAK